MTPARPQPAASGESHVIVRNDRGAVVVVPDSQTLPVVLDAVLSSLAACAPPRPVILDLGQALLTGPMLDAVHRAVCGPTALVQYVGLVSCSDVARHRLGPIAGCRHTVVHGNVRDAVEAARGAVRGTTS